MAGRRMHGTAVGRDGGTVGRRDGGTAERRNGGELTVHRVGVLESANRAVLALLLLYSHLRTSFVDRRT